MKISNIFEIVKRHQWVFIGLVLTGLLILSLIGFSRCMGANACGWLTDPPQSTLDALFYSMQMLVMGYGGVHGSEAPWQIQIARFGFPLLSFYSIIAAAIKLASYRQMKLRVRFWKEHIVLCGCDNQGRALINEYLKQAHPKSIVVIDAEVHPDNVLFEKSGVVFIKEDAKLIESLRTARVMAARCVYVMTGSDHVNLEIFDSLKNLINEDGSCSANEKPRSCFVHINDGSLKSLVDEDLFDNRKIWNGKGWEIRTLNTFGSSARVLLTSDLAPHHFISEDQQPHVLVLGNSWLAEQIIIQGASIGHYPNGRRLRVTYVAEDADQMRDMLFARYPALDPQRFAHLGWTRQESGLLPVIDTCFIAKSPECMTGELYKQITASCKLSVAYICHPDYERALRILSALKSNLVFQREGKNSSPMLVLCDLHGNMNEYVHKDANSRVFDALSASVKLKEGEAVIQGVREDWARTINNHYRKLYGGQLWDELPEGMRDSNRQSADHWQIKLDLLRKGKASDFILNLDDHRDMLMRLEHDRWCAERFMSGWRYCDKPESKDKQKEAKAKKLNWCLCPFDELSPEDQQKDKDVCDIAAKLHGLLDAKSENVL